MTFAQVVEKLRAGGVVVDIGQLTPDTRRWLRQAARNCELCENTSYEFPLPKHCWQTSDPDQFLAYVERQTKARRIPKE